MGSLEVLYDPFGGKIRVNMGVYVESRAFMNHELRLWERKIVKEVK